MTNKTPLKGLTFEQALKRWTNSTKNSMKYAHICAMMALGHFGEHGDATKCQQFYDTMSKHANNYARRTALVLWCCNFANIRFEGKKFLKDKARDNFCDLTGADKTKFWDFAPESEILSYSPEDVVVQLERVISRFENHKRYQPSNPQAELRLAQAKAMVADLETKPLVITADDEEDDGEEPENIPATAAAAA